jgi:Arc/MetJ-type ribon-helix-helix transcriptional regulator
MFGANNSVHGWTLYDRWRMRHSDLQRAPTTLGCRMKRASATPPQVVVRSIAFTQDALETLEQLAARIGPRMGRKSSASAVVRALLRHAQDLPEIAERLAALIEQEQDNVSWGRPRPK